MTTTTKTPTWLPVTEGDRLRLDGWPIEIRRSAEGLALFVEERQDFPWSRMHSLSNLKAVGETKARELAEFASFGAATDEPG